VFICHCLYSCTHHISSVYVLVCVWVFCVSLFAFSVCTHTCVLTAVTALHHSYLITHTHPPAYANTTQPQIHTHTHTHTNKKNCHSHSFHTHIYTHLHALIFTYYSFKRVCSENMVPLRYVDDDNKKTEQYPLNPNGSPDGIAALCSADGRHLAIMPHPGERCFILLYFHFYWV